MKQLILFLLCLSTWTAQAKIYNVKDYGAKADGTTIDSPAINRAIEEAASQGGGNRLFPCGRIRLLFHTFGQPYTSVYRTRSTDCRRLSISNGRL